MMTTEVRVNKVALLLLTAGVWGLLLRPLVGPAPAVAQSGARRQYAFAVVAAKKLSAEESKRRAQEVAKQDPTGGLAASLATGLLTGDDGRMTVGKVQIGGEGSLLLTAAQVSEAVGLAGRAGWQIHSVVPASQSQGFIVLLQR